MTLVLIGKGLLLEGSTPKTEDKQLAGKYPMDPISFEGVKLVFSRSQKTGVVGQIICKKMDALKLQHVCLYTLRILTPQKSLF